MNFLVLDIMDMRFFIHWFDEEDQVLIIANDKIRCTSSYGGRLIIMRPSISEFIRIRQFESSNLRQLYIKCSL